MEKNQNHYWWVLGHPEDMDFIIKNQLNVWETVHWKPMVLEVKRPEQMSLELEVFKN